MINLFRRKKVTFLNKEWEVLNTDVRVSDIPKEGETKMDQLVRWLEERCAYKQPERYNCTPATQTKSN